MEDNEMKRKYETYIARNKTLCQRFKYTNPNRHINFIPDKSIKPILPFQMKNSISLIRGLSIIYNTDPNIGLKICQLCRH